MPCQSLKYWLRAVKLEICQFATQEFIPGETDSKALEQIQELLSAQSARKERKQRKELYALLIWNMPLGFAPQELEVDAEALTDEEIEVLSNIQHQLCQLPTSWDEKRSKLTYINLIRSMEPERMCHRRGSRLEKVTSATTTIQSSTSSNDTVQPLPSDIQRHYDDLSSQLKASVESGALGVAQVERVRMSLHGMYLIAARNELAINSLRECLVSQQGSLASLRSTVDKLVTNGRGEKVDRSSENDAGRGQQTVPDESAGQFVFFDEA